MAQFRCKHCNLVWHATEDSLECPRCEHAKTMKRVHKLEDENKELSTVLTEKIELIHKKNDRMRELEAELSAVNNFQPTSACINALPEKIRRFIHDLETNADPAGNVASIIVLQENVDGLSKMVLDLKAENARLREQLPKKE